MVSSIDRRCGAHSRRFLRLPATIRIHSQRAAARANTDGHCPSSVLACVPLGTHVSLTGSVGRNSSSNRRCLARNRRYMGLLVKPRIPRRLASLAASFRVTSVTKRGEPDGPDGRISACGGWKKLWRTRERITYKEGVTGSSCSAQSLSFSDRSAAPNSRGSELLPA